MACETVGVGVAALRAEKSDRVVLGDDGGEPAEAILAANAEPPEPDVGSRPVGPVNSGRSIRLSSPLKPFKSLIVPMGSRGRRTTRSSFFGANDDCAPDDCESDDCEPVVPSDSEPG